MLINLCLLIPILNFRGAVQFDNGGYHQITLGIDLFCKPVKYSCNCPAIN
jgi:hypothetical protein